MGVKQKEELLCKIAWMFGNNKADKDLLIKAAHVYVKAKNKSRDNRDKWKIKKRMVENGRAKSRSV